MELPFWALSKTGDDEMDNANPALPPPLPGPGGRLSWRRFLGISGLLFLLVLWGVYAIPWDAKPADDADLRPRNQRLAPAENAFTALESAGRKLVVKFPAVNGRKRSWWELESGASWDAAFADEVLAANAEAFKEAEVGLACEHYASPPVVDAVSVMPWLSRHKELVQLLSIKSKRAQLAGDPAAALHAASLGWRVGQLAADNPCSLMEWLVGNSCQHIALAQMERIAADARTPEPVLRDLLGQLDRWDPQAPVRDYQEAMRGDYQMAKNTVELLLYGDGKRLGVENLSGQFSRKPYFFKKNMTERMLADYYHHLIASAELPYPKIRQEYPGMPREPANGWEKAVMVASPNSVGKVMFFMLVPGSAASGKGCQLQAQVAALRLKVALRLYEQRQGRLPETLAALVPEYLKSVPADPYDGQPMRYSKVERKVWAVGRDLKDHGGRIRYPEVFMVDFLGGYDLALPLGTRDVTPKPATPSPPEDPPAAP